MVIEAMDSQEDAEALHRRMGIDYPFPNLASPLFVTRLSVRNQGRIVAATAVKVIGEAFLWVDPEVTAIQRARAVRMLSDGGSQQARAVGLDEVSAWIPPTIEPEFGAALYKMGWRRSPWTSWSRVL